MHPYMISHNPSIQDRTRGDEDIGCVVLDGRGIREVTGCDGIKHVKSDYEQYPVLVA